MTTTHPWCIWDDLNIVFRCPTCEIITGQPERHRWIQDEAPVPRILDIITEMHRGPKTKCEANEMCPCLIGVVHVRFGRLQAQNAG